jgi:hypothetical protein
MLAGGSSSTAGRSNEFNADSSSGNRTAAPMEKPAQATISAMAVAWTIGRWVIHLEKLFTAA